MITLFQAVEEFCKDLEANDRAVNTIKTYRALLKPFLAEFIGKKLDEFSHETMRDYVIKVRAFTKAKAQTRNTEYDKINALFIFWRWASSRFGMVNPMLSIKRPRQPDPDTQAISPEDFARMYRATGANLAGARDRALLCFLGSAGTRADETVNLKIEDIDLQKRRAKVQRGKNGRARVVRFSRWTAQLLRYWVGIKPNGSYLFSRIDGGKLEYSGLRQILRRLAKRAGVDENWQAHKFRHFSIAESLLQGGELTQISKNAGHADISTTVRHYTKFRVDGLDAMDEFDALNSVFGKRDQFKGKI